MRAPAKPRWMAFVLAHGYRASAHDLATIVGQSIEAIWSIRSTGACTKLPKGMSFGELFVLWHGRAPTDDEWPAPRRQGGSGSFEWQASEVALLATLVGQLGVAEIAQVLTNRLREITGDRKATRTRNAVQGRINRIGLQSSDVVGGITTTEAGREIGSLAIVNQMIHQRQIPAIRRGRRWVIPYEAWEAWKAKRVFPPKGHVQLSTIRTAMAIRSDKLSEYARMGLIPTAVRCNPYGTKARSTKFGTWWISKEVADKLLADRRAGLSMPWHGKYADNLRRTYELYKKRRHPACCQTCAKIWGGKNAPRSFEDFALRYPPLAHGAKRHLTLVWSPGLTVAEVAASAGCSPHRVRYAIKLGTLTSTKRGRFLYVSKTDATRWKARKCPTGDSEKSWISRVCGLTGGQSVFSSQKLPESKSPSSVDRSVPRLAMRGTIRTSYSGSGSATIISII
jgi:hypothetical protein